MEKVVVGDMEEDGIADPYKLTFVLKGMDERSIPDARDRYMIFIKQFSRLKIEVTR